MHKVLFPTDFSKNAANAFQYACRFAAVDHSQMIILNSYQVPILSSNESGEELQEAAKEIRSSRVEKLEEFVHGFEETRSSEGLHDLKLTLDTVEGEAVDSIVNYAMEHGVQMIIMGTRGETADQSQLMGSVAAGVMARAHCKVLTVPEQAVYRKPSHIVYALDFEDAENQTLQSIKSFADLYKANITFLHINPDPHYFEETHLENFKRVRQFVSDFEHVRFEIIGDDDVQRALNNYISENEVDLFVMKTRKSMNTASASLTKEMMLTTNIPLLVYHV